MNAEVIQQTVALWTGDPAKAAGRPSVKAVLDGSAAAIEAGAFAWRIGLPPALGGDNSAPSPTLLLLGALAGCAVVFMRDTLAPQLGIEVQAVEATVQCAADSRGLLGMDGVSPDLRELSLDLRIASPGGEAAVRDLLAVWQERCPVYLALTKPMAVSITAAALNG
jgi:uncharacterized OsmC-like protein